MENANEQHKFMDETSKMLATFVDEAEIGMYVTDFYSCEVLYVNRKLASYSGETNKAAFIGKPCWTLIDSASTGRCPFCPYKKLLDENGNPNEPYIWELYIPTVNMWLKVISRIITWNDERLAQLVTFYDISEMKKMQEKLAAIAYIDRLLKTKNDLMLEQDVQNSSVKPSLIIFDVISLQKVNEAYGRTIGDGLLISIRDWLISLKIEHSEIYRIGGDEFCVAIKDISSEKLVQLANKFLMRFAEPWMIEQEQRIFQIYTNATIAAIPSDYIQNDEPLLNLVERTLKTAKERKSVTIYDAKMDKEYKKLLNFEIILKRCTREQMKGFSVHYQPIVEAESGRWKGLEALCRWNVPELGQISPEVFISEAERFELIGTLGIWVLETAIRQCKKWELDKINDFLLHVNTSASQFLDESFAKRVIDILKKNDYLGKNLCLEITESTQFTFTGQSLNTVNYLRANGITIALDDFGTGYTNLYELKNIPADFLKIERTFVSNIENENYTQYLFRVITGLAHTANMRLIAEGVENEDQMEILMKNGANFLQGYFFSCPLTPCELEEKLNNFNTLSG